MNNDRRRDEPRLLILETSGKVGQVAVAEGRRLGSVRSLSESRRHARDLAPAIVELCAEKGWRVRDLDAVIVSLGPGSYTGLRIGIVTAKTLAYASGCAMLGIETFAAIARRTPSEAKVVDVIADGQQQNIYVQRWRHSGKEWEAEALRIRAASEWLADLSPGIWVTGPGLHQHETALPPLNPSVAAELRDPNALSLLELGLLRWRRGDADDLWSLEPLYLRRSSAEEKWDRASSGRSKI